MSEDNIIRVAANSSPARVAGYFAYVYRETGQVHPTRAVGAAAVNVAVKASILAREWLAEDGIDVVFIPAFVDVEGVDRDDEVTAMVLYPVNRKAERQRREAARERMVAISALDVLIAAADPRRRAAVRHAGGARGRGKMQGCINAPTKPFGEGRHGCPIGTAETKIGDGSGAR